MAHLNENKDACVVQLSDVPTLPGKLQLAGSRSLPRELGILGIL